MRKTIFLVVFFLFLPVYGAEIFKNFSINGNTVFYFQSANPNSNLFPSAQKGWGNVLNLEVDYSFKNIEFYARFHNGNGSRIDSVFGDYFFANLNTLADDNPNGNYDLKLLEGYFSFFFFNDKLNVVAGKTEPLAFIDQNEFADDEVSKFIGKPFVHNVFFDAEDLYAPIVGFNYSLNRIEFSGFVQSIEKHKVYFDGEEWTFEETGTHSFKENLFVGFQVNFKSNFNGLKGNYRFYYYNNAHPHFLFNEVLNNPEDIPVLENSDGYGVSFDQYLSENIGMFFRYAKLLREIYSFDKEYSFGFVVKRVFSSKGDFLAGFSEVKPVDNSGYKNERHFEFQYRYSFSEKMQVAFDYQYAKSGTALPQMWLSVFTVRAVCCF